MKQIFKKLLIIIYIIALIVVSFEPWITTADSTYTGDNNQISNVGGSKQTDDGKVKISKNITANDKENYFDIELTVQTKKIVSEITIPQDLAIVLVIDSSNSMGKCVGTTGSSGWNNNCSVQSEKRINMLKEVLTGKNPADNSINYVNNFIDMFAEDSKNVDGDVKRMISVVSFNRYTKINQDWTTYNKNNDATFRTNLKNTISNITQDSGTAPAPALYQARQLLTTGDAANVANKYIIFLTDGYPTSYCSNVTTYDSGNNRYGTCNTYSGSYDDRAATEATEQAILNAEAGIKTYSIGVGVDGEGTYTNESEGGTSKSRGYNSLAPYFVVGYKEEKTITGQTVTGNETITSEDLDGLDLVISNTAKTSALYSNGHSRNSLNNIDNLWTFTKNSDGTYYIKYKSQNNTNYLSIDNSGTGIALRNQDNATKFNVTKNSDGSYQISYTYTAWECIDMNWIIGIIPYCQQYGQVPHTRYIGYDNGFIATDTASNISLSKLNVENTYTTNRITGPEQFKQWLGGHAKDGNTSTNRGISANVTRGNDGGYGLGYYDVTDAGKLKDAYNAIFEGIREDLEELSQAWTVSDPMNYEEGATVSGFSVGEYAEFVNFYETSETENGNKVVDSNGNPVYVIHNTVGEGKVDNEVEFNTTTNSIIWDLKNSDYVKEKYNSETKETTYTYRLTYRVRLMNENGDANNLFDGNTKYSTNGPADLDYVLVENGTITDRGKIDFPNPIVVGRSHSIIFNKLSGYSNVNLTGAKFEIVLDLNGTNTKNMFAEKSHIDENFKMEATSNNGTVIFNNVPSGYDYILREVETPIGYGIGSGTTGYGDLGSKNEFKFSILNGVISENSIPNEVYNYPNYYNLVVKKEIKPFNPNNTKAYIDKTKEFKFQIEVINDTIAKSYNAVYTKNDGTKENITIAIKDQKGTFNLKHNESISISLPYGTEYKVTEIEHSGYSEKYTNNEGIIIFDSRDNQEVPEVLVTNTKLPVDIKAKKQWENVDDYDEFPDVNVILQRSLNNKDWENVANSTKTIHTSIVNGKIVSDTVTWNDLDGDYEYRVKEVIDPNNIEFTFFKDTYKETYDKETDTIIWTVTNTNICSYELPETGSHGGLILIITSIFLIGIPVIYIAYNFLIDLKERISWRFYWK